MIDLSQAAASASSNLKDQDQMNKFTDLVNKLKGMVDHQKKMIDATKINGN